MVKVFKKIIACAMAAALTVGSVGYVAPAVNAKVSSPTTSVKPVKKDDVKTDNGAVVDTKKNGTATITEIPKTKKENIGLSSTVKVNGVKYTVTTIGKKTFENAPKATKIRLPETIKTIEKGAFKGANKLEKLVFNSKKVPTVEKGAFNGLNTKKMTIRVKNMSKKNFKKFEKQLKKAGFKGTIKWVQS